MNDKEKSTQYQIAPVTRQEPLPAEVLNSQYNVEGKKVHLMDYLEVILRRKWIVIVFLISLVVTVTLATFFVQPAYKATATIKINEKRLNVLQFTDILPMERATVNYYNTQYLILRSNNLAKRVVSTLSLESEPEFSAPPSKLSTLFQGSKVKEASEAERERKLIDSFMKRLEVQPVKASQLVNVTFESHNPEFAAKVVNTVADEYLAFIFENTLNPMQKAKKGLEKQIETVRATLESSEEKRNKFIAKENIVFLSGERDRQSHLTEKLSAITRELDKTIAERISKEAIYREVKSSGANYSAVLDNTLIQQLTAEYTTLESEYFKLLKTFKPEYPALVSLKEQLDSVMNRIKSEEQKIVNSIFSDYKISLSKERDLSSAVEKLRQEVMGFQKSMVEYNILKKEVDANRELYNALLQRLRQIDVSSNFSESNVQILDRADIPLEPFKPKKALNLMLALVGGLFGGIFLVFFVEYFDESIKSANDIERSTGLPVLGMVPLAKLESEKLPFLNLNDNSSMAEAYKTISAFIQSSNMMKASKRILITSPLAGDGKTSSAVNTAVSLAGFSGNGIIIDGDLRKPKVHSLLHLENKTGLSSFLIGDLEVDDLIKKSSYEGLDVITAGPIPQNPSALLSSSRMRELVDGLIALYDFIIIDSPPVLGLSDSQILSALIDETIVVVKAGKTPKNTLMQTMKILTRGNAKVLGVVLNGIDFNSAYGAYSYYGTYGDNVKGMLKTL